MNKIAVPLGVNVRRFRKARGMRQEDLAKKVGIHYTFLGHIERGNKLPSLPVLLKIAREVGTTAGALLNGCEA